MIANNNNNNRFSYGSLHWFPYTSICGFCRINYDFIGNLETIKKDAESLEKIFPDTFRNISSVLNSRKNSHRKSSDKLSQKYFSQLPKSLIVKLFDAFKEDFIIGNYPYPTKYLTFGKQ